MNETVNVNRADLGAVLTACTSVGPIFPAKVRRDRLAAALEQGDEGSEVADGWRSIDSAPKKRGLRIIAYLPDAHEKIDVLYGDDDGRIFTWKDFDANDQKPTHWQPLPAPPSEPLAEPERDLGDDVVAGVEQAICPECLRSLAQTGPHTCRDAYNGSAVPKPQPPTAVPSGGEGPERCAGFNDCTKPAIGMFRYRCQENELDETGTEKVAPLCLDCALGASRIFGGVESVGPICGHTHSDGSVAELIAASRSLVSRTHQYSAYETIFVTRERVKNAIATLEGADDAN